jgi:hypothetical protein
MLRCCIECNKIFGCKADGGECACFHCYKLSICTMREDKGERADMTSGICPDCLLILNVHRVLEGKNPIRLAKA